jgi:hypothetical protein
LDKIQGSWWESIQQIGISGTPDILGCIGPYFVAIEVKTNLGKTSALQKYKLGQIKAVGSIALTVTPDSMDDTLKFLENLSEQCLNLKHG